MKTTPSKIIRGALASLVILTLGVADVITAHGGKPEKPGTGGEDSGAISIPVCITFDNSEGNVIRSDPESDPTYCDGDLKGRVSASLAGNTNPEQIVFDTNTSSKSGVGRTLMIDLPGIGVTEAEFVSEWNVAFQAMEVGETKAIGAQFSIPGGNAKNMCLLSYGDTAPTHSEPSCEGVVNSQAWVTALSDGDQDGKVDRWLIWADASVNVCRIQFIGWAPQPPDKIHAPFAMLVEKMP